VKIIHLPVLHLGHPHWLLQMPESDACLLSAVAHGPLQLCNMSDCQLTEMLNSCTHSHAPSKSDIKKKSSDTADLEYVLLYDANYYLIINWFTRCDYST